LTRQVAVGVSEDTTSNFSVALVTVACHRHGVEVIDGSIYLLTLMGSCLVVTLSSAYVVACLCRALTEYVIFRAEMAVVGRKVRHKYDDNPVTWLRCVFQTVARRTHSARWTTMKNHGRRNTDDVCPKIIRTCCLHFQGAVCWSETSISISKPTRSYNVFWGRWRRYLLPKP